MALTARPLLLAVAAVVISFVLAVWVSQRRLNDIEENLSAVVSNAEPSVARLEEARTELDHIALYLDEYVAATAEHVPGALSSRARLHDARVRLRESVDAYGRLPFFPGEEARYRDARADLDECESTVNRILERTGAGDIDAARAELLAGLQPRVEGLSRKLAGIADYDRWHAARALEGIAATRRGSWRLAVGGTALGVALSVVATGIAAQTLWKAAAARQRADEERGARLVAEQQVRLRDQFLVLVTHELRTPLAALKLAVDALRRKPEQPSEALHATAMRQVSRIIALVEDLILVGRLDLGSFSLQPQQVDLSAAVRARIKGHGTSVEPTGGRMKLHADAPVVGWWDPAALARVVDSLLSNAVRFGGGRPIEVAVSQHDAWARLTVSDQGIGIPPELLHAVFDRFSRGVSASNYPGLGLGLYIARSLVERMGGTIAAASHPSPATVFIVELPLGIPAAEAGQASRGRDDLSALSFASPTRERQPGYER
jgi:signal transduction histidine kinase